MHLINLRTLFLTLLFFVCFVFNSNAEDTLTMHKESKIALQFSGGITSTNYTFKHPFDYYGDMHTDNDTLINVLGKYFELNIQLPVKRSRFSICLGSSFMERNAKRDLEKEIGNTELPTFKSEIYKNAYLSLVLGLEYKIINSKHYLLDSDIGFLPAYRISESVKLSYYENNIPDLKIRGKQLFMSPIKISKFIAPVYLKINNSYKLNQHFALGISLGLFYDIIKPFPDNIVKNRLNYNSNILFRYSF